VAKQDTRIPIRLESAAGTGTTYWTTPRTRPTPHHVKQRKYDRRLYEHEALRDAR
jgi:ribosomal protein L33